MDESSAQNVFGDARERRKLRQEQRDLHDTLLENREKIAEVGSSLFGDLREKNNELFGKAKHSREQYNDALNLKEIAKAATSQVIHLDDMSRRFDFESWADTIKHKYENPEDHIFSWVNFGMDCGTLFLSAPRVCPLLGVLKNELKKRAPMIRNPRQEKSAEVRPEEQEEDGETAEATNTRILRLWQYLQGEQERLTQQSQSQNESQGGLTQALEADKAISINILTALVDPTDNVQTIENFFDYSFLIKDKRVVESLDEAGVPVTMPVPQPTDGEDKGVDEGKKQMVLSLAMNDLRDLAQLLPSGYVCPLHRDDPLYEAKDAREQADILATRLDEEENQRKRRKAAAKSSTTPGKGRGNNRGKRTARSDDLNEEEDEDGDEEGERTISTTQRNGKSAVKRSR